MAIVMECTLCGTREEVSQIPCRCGGLGPWQAVEVEDPVPHLKIVPDGHTAPSGPPTPSAPTPPAVTPLISALPPVTPAAAPSPEGWTCDRCGRANSASRPDCIECATVRTVCGGALVSGDAGTHRLAAGSPLPLGRRASFSPAARMLAHFPNVGREHAVLALDSAGTATVTDLSSSNGTWLMEPTGPRRLPAGQPVALPPGSVVQLGNSATGPNAQVTVSAGGRP